jgi:hypothetical protein
MFDAVRFLNDYGIEWRSHGKNVGRGWIAVNDPFTYDDGFHAAFKLSDGRFYSWKTGGASTFNVVKALLGKPDYETLQIVQTYSDFLTLRKNLEVPVIHAEKVEWPGKPLDSMCRKYLRRRGFIPDIIEHKYKVRSGGISGDFAFRLIIPILRDGELATYIGRDVTGKQQIRYKNLPLEKSVIDPKKLLYNEQFVENHLQIGVVEGAMDAWRMGDGFVATLGTSATQAQARALSEYEKVVFLYDPEPEAQRRAKKLAEQVASLGVIAEVVDTEYDHDPGDMTEDEVSYVRRELGFNEFHSNDIPGYV